MSTSRNTVEIRVAGVALSVDFVRSTVLAIFERNLPCWYRTYNPGMPAEKRHKMIGRHDDRTNRRHDDRTNRRSDDRIEAGLRTDIAAATLALLAGFDAAEKSYRGANIRGQTKVEREESVSVWYYIAISLMLTLCNIAEEEPLQ